MKLWQLFTWEMVSHLFRYFLIAGGLWLVFHVIVKRRLSVWYARRLVHPIPLKPHQIRSEMFWAFITFLVFSLVGILIWIFREHTYLYLKISERGSAYLWYSVGAMLVVHDAWFYWSHRLIHHPKLYRFWHRQHHESRTPTPFTSFRFNIPEAFIQAAIVPICLLLFPIHPLAIVLFLTVMTLYNAYGHNMIELYPRSWITKWWFPMNTTTHHSHHHETFKGNFGLYFLFWDKLMGTEIKSGSQSFSKVS